jgi:uncharacterized repeat protein (TIGR01451 family)
MIGRKKIKKMFHYFILGFLLLNLTAFGTMIGNTASVKADLIDLDTESIDKDKPYMQVEVETEDLNLAVEDGFYERNEGDELSEISNEGNSREIGLKSERRTPYVYQDDCDDCKSDYSKDRVCDICEKCEECKACIECVKEKKEIPEKKPKEQKKDIVKKCDFKINGYKYLKDTKTGLKDWKIILENSQGKILDHYLTDDNGYYEFSGLCEDKYLVYEEKRAGWKLTMPEAGSYTVDFSHDKYKDKKYETYDFYNAPGIGGRKIDDSTKKGISDWKIYLQAENGGDWETVRETSTSEEGYYSFFSIEKGKYRLLEEARKGWEYVNYDRKIIEFGNEPVFVDFYNKKKEKAPSGGGGVKLPPSKIVVSKYKDIDGLASTTLDRELIKDISWSYDLHKDGDYLMTRSTVDGVAVFDGLAPGNYLISEVNKEGWTNVIPADGKIEIKITHHETKNIYFVNHKPDVAGEEGAPVLKIDKTVLTPTVIQGARNVPYKIVVHNTGNLTAFDVVISDILPEGLLHTNDNSLTKTWEMGDLKPGEKFELNFFVDVGLNVAPNKYINTAEAIAANHKKVTDTAQLEIKPREGVLPVTGIDTTELLGIFGLFLGLSGTGMALRKKYVF